MGRVEFQAGVGKVRTGRSYIPKPCDKGFLGMYGGWLCQKKVSKTELGAVRNFRSVSIIVTRFGLDLDITLVVFSGFQPEHRRTRAS